MFERSNIKEGRVCKKTGLSIDKGSEFFIKLNAVSAIVFLLVGAIAALLLALTRWQTVHLLPVDWFYRILTVHGINMLIFWILYFEVAILYFASTALLNTRLYSKGLAWASWGLMTVGALTTNGIIFAGKADVLLTSYLPLVAHPLFYLGLILFAVGALIAAIHFFLNVYIAKRDNTYEGSMPLVSFGALAAAIIAILALLHGAVALVPTFTHTLGLNAAPDPIWYRMIWWGLGHQTQQVNVTAMVACWYFLGTLTVGAKPPNEAVCRSAFVLYILFINLASAHHLLVDPGVGAAWKIWNTSYAMYLAVLASMIHGFTVPASVEIGMRLKGYTKGLFNWLSNAPWGNPGFSGFFLSVVIFGFIGGITGVTLGTQQINIIAHNTLRITGHFHATVVGGTTLAFMGLTYYVLPLYFQRNYILKPLARIQPYLFAVGLMMLSLGMSFAGSEGVARRSWDVEPAGIYGASTHIMLAVLGIGGIVLFTAVLLFVVLAVGTVLKGKKFGEEGMECWGVPRTIASVDEAPAALNEDGSEEHPSTPGTMVLVLIFLAAFVIYYFANWLALSDVWHVR